MICIRPMAPLGEIARTSPKLSARITTRIQVAGIPKRWAASATNAAKRSVVVRTIGGLPVIGCAFATGPMMSSTNAVALESRGTRVRLASCLPQTGWQLCVTAVLARGCSKRPVCIAHLTRSAGRLTAVYRQERS